MKNSFLLEIYIPTDIVLSEEVKSVTLDVKEGKIKILPNHADYITAFSSSIMFYVDMNEKKKIVALNNGLLVKYDNTVCISSYSVMIGDTLEEIKNEIKAKAKEEQEKMKEINRSMRELDICLVNSLKNIVV